MNKTVKMNDLFGGPSSEEIAAAKAVRDAVRNAPIFEEAYQEEVVSQASLLKGVSMKAVRGDRGAYKHINSSNKHSALMLSCACTSFREKLRKAFDGELDFQERCFDTFWSQLGNLPQDVSVVAFADVAAEQVINNVDDWRKSGSETDRAQRRQAKRLESLARERMEQPVEFDVNGAEAKADASDAENDEMDDSSLDSVTPPVRFSDWEKGDGVARISQEDAELLQAVTSEAPEGVLDTTEVRVDKVDEFYLIDWHNGFHVIRLMTVTESGKEVIVDQIERDSSEMSIRVVPARLKKHLEHYAMGLVDELKL